MAETLTLEGAGLLPAIWSQLEPRSSFRIYNPAITRFRGNLLMAYRVDSGRRESMQRRIGLCRLAEDLSVVPGSVQPLSDTIQDGDPRRYDPRFLVYGDRLFIHYNNNNMTRPNQIHLVELDPDSLEARSPARPLQLEGAPRQEIEKNWMLFEHEGEILAVYQIAPHTLLRLNLEGRGPVACTPIHTTGWDVSAYAERYGLPRGGAPPVRWGDVYVSFFHSRRRPDRWQWVLRHWPIPPGTKLPRYVAAVERRLRRPFARVRYYGGVYAFAATPPFRPLWLAPEPLLRPETEAPYRYRRRANPYADGVVYPCGAVPWADGNWLVSYGVNDESCCLRIVNVSGAQICQNWQSVL